MSNCQGCGADTANGTNVLHYDSDVGPMHTRCEIKRLQGLYDEECIRIEALEAVAEAARAYLWAEAARAYLWAEDGEPTEGDVQDQYDALVAALAALEARR